MNENLDYLTKSYCCWLDKDTFICQFGRNTDEDGDVFEYLCEYHQDEDRFVFYRMYEDQTIEAVFTKEQQVIIMDYIKREME